MKKKIKLIFLALIVLFALLGQKLTLQSQSTNQLKNNMQYRIAVQNPSQSSFHLDKAHSDAANNQIILNAVIGTLVKYGISGKIEPYIAESWTVSPDQKNWKFKLRANLKCEDGTLITADLFKENLLKSLKEYALNGSTIMFDHLEGWNDFISGHNSNLIGLKSSHDILEFHFTEYPDEFLEVLRMPYFGLWAEINNQIISSGPYRLNKVSPSKISLELRKDWFTVKESSFSNLEFSFIGLNEVNSNSELATITRMPIFSSPNAKENNGYWIINPPTILEAFVLSPFKHNFFNNAHHRQVFKNRLKMQMGQEIKSEFFYPSAKTSGLDYSQTTYQHSLQNIKLTFALERISYLQEEIDAINKVINFALEGSGAQYELIQRNSSDKTWNAKSHANNYFDARIMAVDSGGSPSLNAIKMMFCTKLGVNFPDANGNICRFVEENIKTHQVVNQDLIDQFNTIVNEDAVVIPIGHRSGKWLVSNDIDPTTLSPTTLYPQFELIKLK